MAFSLGLLALEATFLTRLTFDFLLTTIPVYSSVVGRFKDALFDLQACLSESFPSFACLGCSPEWIDWFSVNYSRASATILEHIAHTLPGYMSLSYAL